MRGKLPPKRRNPIARALRAKTFAARVLRARKGKGSFRRKPRMPENGQ
jgi:stalled ribosome alternative rescue factor ArfA